MSNKKIFKRSRLRGRQPKPARWISLIERLAFTQHMFNMEMEFMWGQRYINDKEEAVQQ